MRATNTAARSPRLLRALRLARFLVFCAGTASVVWFFFSFVGLAIGLLYLLLMKDRAWRRNGLVLACSIGLSTLVAHLGAGLSPLFLAMASGMPVLGGSLISFMVWDGLRGRSKLPARVSARLTA